jgi:hypothetical protein
MRSTVDTSLRWHDFGRGRARQRRGRAVSVLIGSGKSRSSNEESGPFATGPPVTGNKIEHFDRPAANCPQCGMILTPLGQT